VIWSGGEALGASRLHDLSARISRPSSGDPVVHIAADSGLDHARAAGVAVDVAVGDFDSVSAEGLTDAEANGVELIRHDPDKDRTDLELALDLALERGAATALVVGGSGGRLDHFAGNLGVLASPRYAALRIEAWTAEATVWVVRGEQRFDLDRGALLSLVPIHGAAEGVETEGLRWPLHREDLPPGSGRGMSNVVVSGPVRVVVGGGVLLVIAPGGEDGEPWPS
jgi:thiamine pyrophosphokinase